MLNNSGSRNCCCGTNHCIAIFQLPLDIESLSDAEKRERLDQRKPRKKVVIEEDLEDNFNANKYVKFVKKSR